MFATRLTSTGVAPVAGDVPVTGAVPGKNRSNQDWWILGTTTQYHTVQDHAKAKLAYDFSPTLRASSRSAAGTTTAARTSTRTCATRRAMRSTAAVR